MLVYARARELEIRENLLMAAEQRLESKAAEIKAVEGGNAAAAQKRDEADAAKFKNIVTMYENMKPKDAAKIFDRLEMKILIEVAWQFNPRKLSDVMALMQPNLPKSSLSKWPTAPTVAGRLLAPNCQRSKAARTAAKRRISTFFTLQLTGR